VDPSEKYLRESLKIPDSEESPDEVGVDIYDEPTGISADIQQD